MYFQRTQLMVASSNTTTQQAIEVAVQKFGIRYGSVCPIRPELS